MANFDCGVSGYVTGTAFVQVHFPVDRKGNADISCNQCRFFRRSSRSCALNDSICAFPEKYVGQDCPLILVENTNNNNEEENY